MSAVGDSYLALPSATGPVPDHPQLAVNPALPDVSVHLRFCHRPQDWMLQQVAAGSRQRGPGNIGGSFLCWVLDYKGTLSRNKVDSIPKAILWPPYAPHACAHTSIHVYLQINVITHTHTRV